MGRGNLHGGFVICGYGRFVIAIGHRRNCQVNQGFQAVSQSEGPGGYRIAGGPEQGLKESGVCSPTSRPRSRTVELIDFSVLPAVRSVKTSPGLLLDGIDLDQSNPG